MQFQAEKKNDVQSGKIGYHIVMIRNKDIVMTILDWHTLYTTTKINMHTYSLTYMNTKEHIWVCSYSFLCQQKHA